MISTSYNFQLSEAVEERDDDTLKKLLLNSHTTWDRRKYDCLYCFNDGDIHYITQFLLENPHVNSCFMISNVLGILPFHHACLLSTKIQKEQPEWLLLGKKFFASMHFSLQDYEEHTTFLNNLNLTPYDFLMRHMEMQSHPFPQGQIRWLSDVMWNNFESYSSTYKYVFQGKYLDKNALNRPFALLLKQDIPQTNHEETFLHLMDMDLMLAYRYYNEVSHMSLTETEERIYV